MINKTSTICSMLASTLILGISTTNAAIVAQKKSGATWDPKKETHVIFASKGLIFASTGYKQAQVYSHVFPQNQILFITTKPGPDSSYPTVKQVALKADGFSIVEDQHKAVTNLEFINLIKKNTTNIRSIDIIGHNGIQKGPWLEEELLRLDYTNEALMSQLKPLFSRNAFARLIGCNTGWNVAPNLSKFWGVPALSSFNATSFYYLSKSGSYDLLRVEGDPEMIRSKVTTDSVSQVDLAGKVVPQLCPQGQCLTLRPESAPYHYVIHKDPRAAWLPYMKIICDASISDAKCARGFADSFTTAIRSSPNQQIRTNKAAFMNAIQSSLCEANGTSSSQAQCLSAVKAAHTAGNLKNFPYRLGTPLKCSALRACKFVHESIDIRVNAASENSLPNTTEEYIKAAAFGFDQLQLQ